MSKLDEINDQIGLALLKIAELEAEREKLLNDPQECELAEFLHKTFCNGNHTDECSWHYEKGWSEYAHNKYREKANKILTSGYTVNDVYDIISVYNGFKDI